jgi:hypothetical protein
MSESKIIIITIILMVAFSYPMGYWVSLYFEENLQLSKVIHLSFIVLFFTSFYASIKNIVMKVLKGELDD